MMENRTLGFKVMDGDDALRWGQSHLVVRYSLGRLLPFAFFVSGRHIHSSKGNGSPHPITV